MEKHLEITMNLEVWDRGEVDLCIPCHITVKELIELLGEIFKVSKEELARENRSLKGEISMEIIEGNLILMDSNIFKGEIYKLI